MAATSGQDASAAVRMNDLLLPLVKGVGSERSYELLGAQSLQTLGGSGFLQDYPIEQYIRDAKIDTLYEGTTAIQGMDLFFLKIVRDQGQALTVLMNEISTFIESEAGNGQLKNERGLLADARLTCRRWSRRWSPTSPDRSRTCAVSTRWASTPVGCSCRWVTSSSAGFCCGRPMWPWPS